ncbi:MAG TPA: hypothetical protein VMW00_03835 [Dehalococcoidales bacterium]|nr:hypothetical protein [Dehalococcoidales bacterium]
MQAKSKLYARRLRGDIGPLNFDPASRLPGRIFGPAVSLTGYMQDYEEATDIQHFTLGSRMQLIGGRVFHYARVDTPHGVIGGGGTQGIVNTSRGVKNPVYQAVEGLPSPAAVAPVAPIALAGALQVVVTVAVTDGLLSDGAIGANELAGGHIVIFPFGLQPRGIVREILTNTATSAATTFDMTVTLDRPLPVAIAANSTAACMANEYAAVSQNDEWMSVVGVAMVIPTDRQYLWLQTWGPTWLGAQLDVGDVSGVHPMNKAVVWWADGSLHLHSHADPLQMVEQYAGYVMTTLNPYDGFHPALDSRGAPFIYLQGTP